MNRLYSYLSECGSSISILGLLGGTNDVSRNGPGFGPMDVYQRLETMHRAAHSHGAFTVVVTLPPIHRKPVVRQDPRMMHHHHRPRGEVAFADKVALINSRLASFAAANADRCVLADLYGALSRYGDEAWDDNIHLSATGYDILADCIFSAIQGWAAQKDKRKGAENENVSQQRNVAAAAPSGGEKVTQIQQQPIQQTQHAHIQRLQPHQWHHHQQQQQQHRQRMPFGHM